MSAKSHDQEYALFRERRRYLEEFLKESDHGPTAQDKEESDGFRCVIVNAIHGQFLRDGFWPEFDTELR